MDRQLCDLCRCVLVSLYKFDFKNVPSTVPLNGIVSVTHPDTAESEKKLYKISTEEVDHEVTNSAILLPSLSSKKLQPVKKVSKKMTIASIEVAESVKISKGLETTETLKLKTPKRRRSLFFDSKPALVKCSYKVMKKRKKEFEDS
ncbi:hypothetical protein HELRODRAFT_176217 [Helobdella robusta]|uniref:Uncharacterized protein n=1 Tax=Helobdella robusta TaxID=6412 RepID=T1FAB2_HELRO|nr:hypothetical protein HELRODRAFT_176217 [Helobdella robusta]ESN99921.1 hypothetical protein HELRODRAFT_176217 [Helobdella robusta]